MRKAAIFDLDGPIFFYSTSERYFVYKLFQKFHLNLLNFFPFLYESFQKKSFTSSKAYYRGKNYQMINSLAKEIFSKENIITHITKKSLQKIEEHRKEGCLLILISGSPQFIINQLNKFLNFDIAVGTTLEVINNKLTGKVICHPIGKKKAEILEELSEKYKLSLHESYGYGNSFKDIFFLEKLGFPIAVNPDRKLKKFAKQKNWKIAYWE
jgi:HAD superfamily hydrolase (TIGR01490 family)